MDLWERLVDAGVSEPGVAVAVFVAYLREQARIVSDEEDHGRKRWPSVVLDEMADDLEGVS